MKDQHLESSDIEYLCCLCQIDIEHNAVDTSTWKRINRIMDCGGPWAQAAARMVPEAARVEREEKLRRLFNEPSSYIFVAERNDHA